MFQHTDPNYHHCFTNRETLYNPPFVPIVFCELRHNTRLSIRGYVNATEYTSKIWIAYRGVNDECQYGAGGGCDFASSL
jgi:hypothetical protein